MNRNNVGIIAGGLFLIILFAACQKVGVNEPKQPELVAAKKNKHKVFEDPNIKFLGHKGAGSNNYNEVHMEMSIASIKQALAVLDGVEVDVQMSLDGTIWMFHNSDVNAVLCTPGPPRSIITMHDNEISQLKLCSRTKTGRIYRFSELMSLWNSAEYPNGFYISLDIKTEHPRAILNAVGGENVYLKRFAQKLAGEIAVLQHPASQLMMEKDNPVFRDELRKYTNGKEVKYYVDGYKPFDVMVQDALRLGFDGVSVNFRDKKLSAARIKAAQARGLKVQLWTPYYDDEVKKAYNMHPDFIQTDQTYVKADLGLN